jgi:hypothetical protein
MSKKVLPICELSFSCKLAADREQPNEDAEDHHCDLEHSSFCLRCNAWKKKDVTMPAQLENTKGVTKEATKQPRGSLAPKASGFDSAHGNTNQQMWWYLSCKQNQHLKPLSSIHPLSLLTHL